MLSFIKSLFKKKPAPFTSNRKQTKHAWANDALQHINGTGSFIVRPPETVTLANAQAAVIARLQARFGTKRVRTKKLTDLGIIEVNVK